MVEKHLNLILTVNNLFLIVNLKMGGKFLVTMSFDFGVVFYYKPPIFYLVMV
jgi:hypothetical protein